ncbi:hypothetical protein BN1221_04721c [Brenneria goodwinii]|uniref:Uncharacterized protein n=1 Tax=Brenneria goodwinii TaxID=1109412 RepID=A0A0G4K283_9GAMM|nr:hypothetical protein BN1221_04721c [Brenneria goodwinii]
MAHQYWKKTTLIIDGYFGERRLTAYTLDIRPRLIIDKI